MSRYGVPKSRRASVLQQEADELLRMIIALSVTAPYEEEVAA